MKTSKKQINEVLRTENTTEIFKIAKLNGVDVSNRETLMIWIKENAPTQKVLRKAYDLSYNAGFFKNFRVEDGGIKNKVIAAINHAKLQKANGYMETNYGKILVTGKENIYWAHPSYGHRDYNKTVAFTNNFKNQKLAATINAFLTK